MLAGYMSSSALRWNMMAPDSASISTACGALTTISPVVCDWARTRCAALESGASAIAAAMSAAQKRPPRTRLGKTDA